jgi:hypothetical protein
MYEFQPITRRLKTSYLLALSSPHEFSGRCPILRHEAVACDCAPSGRCIAYRAGIEKGEIMYLRSELLPQQLSRDGETVIDGLAAVIERGCARRDVGR